MFRRIYDAQILCVKFNYMKKLSTILVLISLLTISRIIIYNYLGITLSPPSYGYHLLEISLLKDDLFSSLIYLHSQPFLWNLFNGILVKIFNADIDKISIFYNLYHYILTLLVIYYSIKIAGEFNLTYRSKLLLVFFVGLNPTVIFFENIFSYAHTTLFFFTLITYSIIKFFKSNNPKYEIYVYLNILILSMIWVLFQPILLITIFVIMRLFKKIPKKNFFIFLLIFIVSLTPMIKNKIIFDTYATSTKGGQDFGTVFYDWQKYCGHPIKDKDFFTEKYFNEYQRYFDHSSLVGDKAKFNNLGVIVLGKECFKKTLSRIKKEPLLYIDGRIRAFLASHGKFGFDYVYPNPISWKKYYQNVNKYYENDKIKLLRQIIVFTLKMTIYFIIIRFLLKTKNKSLRNGLLVSAFLYIYLLSVATLAAGTEQERALYTGFIVNIIFLIIVLKKKLINYD